MTPDRQIKAALKDHPFPVKWVRDWDSARIAGKGTWAPKFVMLHHTAGTDSLKVLRNTAWAPVPGAHFLIDRDGTVHVISASKTYHAGRGGPRWGVAAGMMNGYAWGIEIEDLGRAKTMTAKQIKSAAHLSAGLLDAMGKDLDALIQHKEWNPAGKVDTRYSTSFWRDRVRAASITPPTGGNIVASSVTSTVTMWDDYSGKPKEPQVVPADGKWHKVEGIPLKAPPVSGREDHFLYLRLNFGFRAWTDEMAKVSCKWVRDGGTPDDPSDDDGTAYKELHFEHGTRSVPFDQKHVEQGEAGVGGAWFVNFDGGLESVEITTRYAKTYVLHIA